MTDNFHRDGDVLTLAIVIMLLTVIFLGRPAFGSLTTSIEETTETILCAHVVPAIVVRVIDGDTFVVKAQMWPRQLWTGSVRLVGVNAPEVHSTCKEEGEAAARATDVLKGILPVDSPVLLCNPQEDVYPGRVDATVLTTTGRVVSAMLLEQGVVRPYDGKRKRPPWCGGDSTNGKEG